MHEIGAFVLSLAVLCLNPRVAVVEAKKDTKRRNRTRTMNRSTLALLILFCTILPQSARSAGNKPKTQGVLSLEWLVDSADEIYLVHFGSPDAKGFPAVHVQKMLKAREDESQWDEQRIAEKVSRFSFRPNTRPREGEDWLFFARGGLIPYVFRGINLTDPTKHYRTAAVTAKGDVVPNRQAIIEAVEARVRGGHRLTVGSRRRDLDTMRDWSAKGLTHKHEPGQGPIYLKDCVGAILVRVHCDYWATEGSGDRAVLIDRVMIPAAPEDHRQLLDVVRQGAHSDGRPDYCYPILSLVNFPGDETEACLEDTLQDPTRAEDEKQACRDVLEYFVYHRKRKDPRNKALVGRWLLRGNHETILISLSDNQTFLASSVSRPQGPAGVKRHLWDGLGYWMVREGRLSIMRTQVRQDLEWSENRRELFRNKRIEKITRDEVTLEDGPEMVRW